MRESKSERASERLREREGGREREGERDERGNQHSDPHKQLQRHPFFSRHSGRSRTSRCRRAAGPTRRVPGRARKRLQREGAERAAAAAGYNRKLQRGNAVRPPARGSGGSSVPRRHGRRGCDGRLRGAGGSDGAGGGRGGAGGGVVFLLQGDDGLEQRGEGDLLLRLSVEIVFEIGNGQLEGEVIHTGYFECTLLAVRAESGSKEPASRRVEIRPVR
jgi:hypothetical protein